LAAWDSLSGAQNPFLVDGATLTAGPGGRLISEYQLKRFDGTSWQSEGPPIDVAEDGIAK
jgi:hypothetical protein